MKKIFLLLLVSLAFLSCETKDGIGLSPQVNLTEYTFSQSEDSIEIYSKINQEFHLIYEPTFDTANEKPVYTFQSSMHIWQTSWYIIKTSDHIRYLVKVKPNTTGKSRQIPVILGGDDYVNNRVKYIQSK